MPRSLLASSVDRTESRQKGKLAKLLLHLSSQPAEGRRIYEIRQIRLNLRLHVSPRVFLYGQYFAGTLAITLAAGRRLAAEQLAQ